MSKTSKTTENIQTMFIYSILFLLARIVLILSLPLEGIKAYGDFWNYYQVASQGVPYFDLWVEFPPIFPFLSRVVYLLVGGKEHAFIYLLALIFSLVQAVNIFLFRKISQYLLPEQEANQRSIMYAFMLVCLFYGWAYFDSLVVLFMLLGINSLLGRKDLRAGIALGIGGLLKWFPLLLLPAIWKRRTPAQAARIILLALILLVFVWGVFGVISPDYTKSSLLSQTAKGSWETIWAVLDGNLSTGNFHPAINRLIPATAFIMTGNPAQVNPFLTLFVFGGIGLYVFLRADLNDNRIFLSFITFTLLIFLIWSPGYSPQWVLYLIPLLLLSFGSLRGFLASTALVMINLLEWPVILSRGWFGFLEELVIIRTILYLLLAVILAQDILGKGKAIKVIPLGEN